LTQIRLTQIPLDSDPAHHPLAFASPGVVRLKFKADLGRNEVKPVTPDDLNNISTAMEKCTKRLPEFFWSFVDYHEWLIKRTPVWLTPNTPLKIILDPEKL